jgi:deoxyribodipyrimidine photolyase-related protein
MAYVDLAQPDAPEASAKAHAVAFAEALRKPPFKAQGAPGERQAVGEPTTWHYVPYDQLTWADAPWTRLEPRAAGLVFVESAEKARRRPYHQQKLAFVLANQRRYAIEAAERGHPVAYLAAEAPVVHVLRAWCARHGALTMMQAAERELRVELGPLARDGLLTIVPHEGWLTTSDLFERACGAQSPWRMDAFYREARRASGILMERGKPVGGRFSFDGENREAWSGDPPAPEGLRHAHGAVEAEVECLVRARFGDHPGRVDLGALPTTAQQAEEAWLHAERECLEHFGPYEDAMSRSSRGLFHARIAHLLNIQRLSARRVLQGVLASKAPLPSIEGFVRQVLGWREFVRHVHERTDGFRDLPGVPRAEAPRRRDAGWWSLSGKPDSAPHVDPAPAALGAALPLPPAWWGRASGLACLDRVVASVMEDGWCHHIERLMVLANIATLLDVDARELADWFWCAYIDAYDWVVEPNVLGMGTFAAGETMTTKPYISGSAYIDKMGDDCATCAFKPGKDCPLTPLYWAFLARHEGRLAGNQRMLMPLRSLARRDRAKREEDARIHARVVEELSGGRRLSPGLLAGPARGGPRGSDPD